MSHFDWPIKKEIETLHSPQHRVLYYTNGMPTFWITYVGETRTTLG